MTEIPAQLEHALREHGQEQVLLWWSKLDEHQRAFLLSQLSTIDLPHVSQLFQERGKGWELPSSDRIEPIPVTCLRPDDAEVRELGEKAVSEGQVAALVVAGGQGTRLGFDPPKGMYPIGPVSGLSLFQIHAEKLLAVQRRYGARVPLLVMTSEATDAATREFFQQHNFFGLPTEDVHFFCQGTMPAVDLQTGRLLMESPGRLATSPNGHGGVLLALHDSGLLEMLSEMGVRDVFYFQVDNPLVKIADPLYLGFHRKHNAQVSSKVIAKKGPTDRLGNLVLIDGKCSIIEYSDLPDEMANARVEDGGLRFSHGNPAIHIFSVEFLRQVAASEARIPFHLARKKVPHVTIDGEQINPQEPNAIKFEMFVFDLLPLAERWTAVETTYEEEFEPLKNAEGKNSPESVKKAMSDLAMRWLREAGADVSELEEQGGYVEISPLFALDQSELERKIERGWKVTQSVYLDNVGKRT
ncbi:MAG: UTP--glucose-1-phosphate uridylyltransferase [Gemmataceae bacterium]